MRYTILAALLFLPAAASAQTPLLPGQVIAFEQDPGMRQDSPTSPNLVPRPEANIAFEYRIDGAATPIAAVKASPCTPVTAGSPVLTCRLRPPALTAGAHTIQVRALPSPAEAGISPSDYTPTLSIAVIMVTPPGVPSNLRITPSQP